MKTRIEKFLAAMPENERLVCLLVNRLLSSEQLDVQSTANDLLNSTQGAFISGELAASPETSTLLGYALGSNLTR